MRENNTSAVLVCDLNISTKFIIDSSEKMPELCSVMITKNSSIKDHYGRNRKQNEKMSLCCYIYP